MPWAFGPTSPATHLILCLHVKMPQRFLTSTLSAQTMLPTYHQLKIDHVRSTQQLRTLMSDRGAGDSVRIRKGGTERDSERIGTEGRRHSTWIFTLCPRRVEICMRYLQIISLKCRLLQDLNMLWKLRFHYPAMVYRDAQFHNGRPLLSGTCTSYCRSRPHPGYTSLPLINCHINRGPPVNPLLPVHLCKLIGGCKPLMHKQW
jgi:hypothetical protein